MNVVSKIKLVYYSSSNQWYLICWNQEMCYYFVDTFDTDLNYWTYFATSLNNLNFVLKILRDIHV